ncbi:4Fe-4S dicluster domain-containing protein [Oleiharenicola sp. Vm1]|uniref:4Fe-4S dicluster domain-containing protein n=1 Tax=Oleiharenicola sp. Vm1 TaxID=3398393 RepID=UPI0039F4C8D8
MTPTRETFGNIPLSSQLAFYALAAATMGVFAWGVWRRVKLWRLGTSINAHDLVVGSLAEVWKKIRPGAARAAVEAGAQQRVRGHGFGTVAHVSLYVGFMALFAGTVLLEADNVLSHLWHGLKFHQGAYYVAYEFTLDVLGLLFLLGTLAFLARRLRRPSALGHRATDWYVLLAFLAIGVTGYLVEALRLLWQQPSGIGAHCSPVGLWLAGWLHLGEAEARHSHFIVWWIHSVLVFGFIASIPFTRLFHFVAGPLNLFLTKSVMGVMPPVTMEEVEATGRVGPADIRHFSQQQLLSLDACMECGRCEEVCPAFATAKPLSPKRVVQDLKGAMEKTAAALAAGREADVPPLHEATIAAETLWSCTACNACVNTCPVRVDQLTFILTLRRHLVAEGGLSGTAATALRRMQSNGNPWGLPAAERTAWTDALKPKS